MHNAVPLLNANHPANCYDAKLHEETHSFGDVSFTCVNNKNAFHEYKLKASGEGVWHNNHILQTKE